MDEVIIVARGREVRVHYRTPSHSGSICRGAKIEQSVRYEEEMSSLYKITGV